MKTIGDDAALENVTLCNRSATNLLLYSIALPTESRDGKVEVYVEILARQSGNLKVKCPFFGIKNAHV